MFKSKHSGWTYDLKRTPFSADSPISGILQNASKKLNDLFWAGAFGEVHAGDSGNLINQAFAPLGGLGNDIASGLGSVDKAVNELPGGWALPAAVAATVAAPYAAPLLAEGLGGAALGTDAYMASAGLAPGVFEGAAFTLPETLGAAGAGDVFAGYSPTGSEAGYAGNTTPVGYSSATGSVIGDQPGDYPMPGENGTASQWTPSNINSADVTKLLDYNAAYGSGMTSSEVLSELNKARQGLGITSNLAKLLSGVAGMGNSTTASINGQNSANTQQLANLLSGGAPQTNSFIGQIKSNQNPFLFASPGQTEATQGTYDVSGSNLANALRKT